MSKPKWHNMRPEQAELYKIAKRKGCSEDASMYLAVTLAGLPSGTVCPSWVGASGEYQRELIRAGLIEIHGYGVRERIHWFTPDELRLRRIA